jgi:hypothetical protein
VDAAKAPFDATDHHIADHLAGDAGSGCHPENHLAIMAIQRKGEANDLTVPLGEFQGIRTPSGIRTDRCDLAVMLTRSPAPGMAFEQLAMLLHQSVDALGIDRG